MPSRRRSQALFDLSRALQAVHDPAEVEAVLSARAHQFSRGRMSIRRWDHEPDPGGHRPAVAKGLLVLPLISAGRVLGVIEVEGASDGEIASGGMQPWYALAGVVAAALDHAEQFAALQSTEARFRSLVEQIPAVTYVDEAVTARPLYVSPQLEELFAVPAAEWLDGDDGWASRIHPDDREATTTGYDRAVAAGETWHSEYRITGTDGIERWVRDQAVIVNGDQGTPAEVHGVIHDVTERKLAEQRYLEAEERLSHLAYHDPLTGLPNREMFREHLEVALARAEREGSGVAVLFVDLDDFKLVNDSFGHGAGDELLIEVAARLRAATRTTDVVARQSGDEFLILVADLTVGSEDEEFDIAELSLSVAENLRRALAQPFVIADTEIYCSGSVGISLFPVDAADGESLLKHSDIAMYRAKERGRDGHHLYQRESGDATARLSMAGRLRRAIERDQFVLYYQPLVDLRTSAIVGVEALIRWADGDRGLVMPADFIPLAERTGMIAPISDWVINEACRQGAEWRNMGLDLYVSINLPPVFWQPTAMRTVLATIESFGLSPDRMMVELTESAMMQNHRARSQHRRAARARPEARDRRLRHRPLIARPAAPDAVTTLKIDRSFISTCRSTTAPRCWWLTMIALADGLGLQALAEGIETDAQRRWLMQHGCPLGQGFYFSRAVPADQIAPLCERFSEAA